MSALFWFGLGFLALIAFYFFNKWNMRPVHWEHQEVIDLLDSWINDDVDWQMWDFFEACKIDNPNLEAIRQQALEATYWKSPYVECSGEAEGLHLNEQGKELFRKLKAQCL